MWIGCEIEWPTGGTAVQFMDRLGVWLVANAGSLEVRHRPGVDLEWKSRAPVMERGHFRMTGSGDVLRIGGCHSPGWADDVAAKPLPLGGWFVWDSTFASAGTVLKFVIETHSGRAWMRYEMGWQYKLFLCDVLFRPVGAKIVSGASFCGDPYGGYVSWTRMADGSFSPDGGGSSASPVLTPDHLGEPRGAPYGGPAKSAVPVAGVVLQDIFGSAGQSSINTALIGAWADDDLVADMEDYELRAVLRLDSSKGVALPCPLPGNWSVA